nr:hypothetical protein GCM10020093_074420 [Planobispora longispora]
MTFPTVDASQENPSSGNPPAESRPVRLTVRDARRVHDRYARDLSLAQQDMDDRAMGRLERGLALEMSRAAFETARVQGTGRRRGSGPGRRSGFPATPREPRTGSSPSRTNRRSPGSAS